MKKLSNTYRKNGCTFTEVSRIGDVAVYEQSEPQNYYEVFEIKKIKESEAFGKLIPAHEAIPGNEEWGELGFTCYGISAANKKAREILNKIIRRKTGIVKGLQ